MASEGIVVMGVSGCGKSTIGRALAEALGLSYVEGDELHPPENVAKMASGMALTDADREGWLQAVAQQLDEARTSQRGVVVACSALKRSYREQLRAAAPDLLLVYLSGSPDLLAQRLMQRQGHYMPASLLQSQLDTLEPPQVDEQAFCADIATAPDQIVANLVQQMHGLPRFQLRA